MAAIIESRIHEEFNRLIGEARNIGSQQLADKIFEDKGETFQRAIGNPPTNIRASSPHILNLQDNGDDTRVTLYGSGNREEGLNLAAVSRDKKAFAFNMGVAVIKQSQLKHESIDIDLGQSVLDRLEIDKEYKGYGDHSRSMHISRVDEAGSVIVEIKNGGQLSALFSQADIKACDYQTMTGLWTLGLALKIQQQAEESGTSHNLMNLGMSNLPDAFRGTISRMLLSLDNK